MAAFESRARASTCSSVARLALSPPSLITYQRLSGARALAQLVHTAMSASYNEVRPSARIDPIACSSATRSSARKKPPPGDRTPHIVIEAKREKLVLGIAGFSRTPALPVSTSPSFFFHAAAGVHDEADRRGGILVGEELDRYLTAVVEDDEMLAREIRDVSVLFVRDDNRQHHQLTRCTPEARRILGRKGRKARMGWKSGMKKQDKRGGNRRRASGPACPARPAHPAQFRCVRPRASAGQSVRRRSTDR
jgi:hypothetical protein